MDDKQKRIDPDTLMERTRATVCYVNARSNERTKAFAFLSLFHPEMPLEQRLRLANDMAREEQPR